MEGFLILGNSDCYIGIDLGGTNIVAAVFNENFKIMAKLSCKTNLPKTPEQLARNMARLVHGVLQRAGVSLSSVVGVGFGAPGIVDSASKLIKYSCNFGYVDEPLALILQQILKKPVKIENDANAAALGEFHFRKAIEPNLSSIVLLTLGTGVGGGIVLDGKIYGGFNCCGAEIGHMIIKKNGRLCKCGRRGCFETYASATGLLKTAFELLKSDKKSRLWQVYEKNKKISAKSVFDAVRAGDELAIKIKKRFVSDLGEGVVNVVNIFQPQLVCIGGGLSREGRALIWPLQNFVRRFDYAKSVGRCCRVEACRLKNDAGLLGAAMLFKR